MPDDPERTIIRRELDTDMEDSAVQIAEHIAEIEGTDVTDLATMYDCVDGVLDHLFSHPPDETARMEIRFSYETYRVTVDQDGTAEFVKTK